MSADHDYFYVRPYGPNMGGGTVRALVQQLLFLYPISAISFLSLPPLLVYRNLAVRSNSDFKADLGNRGLN